MSERSTNRNARAVEPGYVSIEDFIRIARVKEATIRKRKDDIPGLSYDCGEYKIIEGTRYPCNLGRNKIENSEKRRYLLLKAISEYCYIDHIYLQVYRDQFVGLLRELLSAGLIQLNNLGNHFGANAYDCTERGDAILRMKRKQAIIEITNLVATAAGTFTGAVLSEVSHER